MFDWIFFLDTNFLFSTLKLHSHPENLACHALINLSQNNNNFNFKFYYLNITLNELKSFVKEFQEGIKTISNINKIQIQSMLESNNLDDFARAYYENLLTEPQTMHPSDKIKYASQILKDSSINVFNDISVDEFLNAENNNLYNKQKEYKEYEDVTQIAEEKRKSYNQLDHDINLREWIIKMRKTRQSVDITDTKYYGLTLDTKLIDCDKYLAKR